VRLHLVEASRVKAKGALAPSVDLARDGFPEYRFEKSVRLINKRPKRLAIFIFFSFPRVSFRKQYHVIVTAAHLTAKPSQSWTSSKVAEGKKERACIP
jgi:hypothetical protein